MSEEIKIEVKNTLNANEMTALYYKALALLYNDKGEYQFEFAAYIWRRCVIEAYTDYPLSEDLNENYAQCYGEIWDAVYNDIITHSPEQYEDIYDAVKKYVETREARESANAGFKQLMENMQVVTQTLASSGDWASWLSNKEDKSPSPIQQSVGSDVIPSLTNTQPDETVENEPVVEGETESEIEQEDESVTEDVESEIEAEIEQTESEEIPESAEEVVGENTTTDVAEVETAEPDATDGE